MDDPNLKFVINKLQKQMGINTEIDYFVYFRAFTQNLK